MKAIITVGISASGKSTWASEYAVKNNALVTCRDDLRFSLTKAEDWSKYKFNKKLEAMITDLQENIVEKCAELGKDVVIADTNLSPKYLQKWVEFCEKLDFDVVVREFPIDLEEAWRRDAVRTNGVGRDVIYKQWQQWLVYKNKKTYVPNPSLPPAIIFDIDGTLAHMTNRTPYQYDLAINDAPDLLIRKILWNFQEQNGYKAVLLSGRDEECRDVTHKWCDANFIIYDSLVMRPHKDFRKDSVVKEELFWQYVAPYYNVLAVFDDRPQVIRMWHDLGIPKVVAVANQNVEF